MKFAASLPLFACAIACGNSVGLATNGTATSSTSSGSGTTGGSSSGSGAGTGSGSTSGFTGTAITAPSEQWTWVPFSEAVCGNGTPTGIGVNLNPASTEVLIYLEGGGACYSDLTCYTIMSATYFNSGYGALEFASESADLTGIAEPGGFFDRTTSANPFQSYSYIYVPYCTGDLHAGDNVVQYPGGTANFVGYANLTAYLSRILPTFPAATRVVLAGSSAGGLGALYNWSRVQKAFGTVPVTLIDDSGTFLPGNIMDAGIIDTSVSTQAWNLTATEPAGCTGCAASFDALYAFGAAASPGQREALLSYKEDSVLPAFYGISETQFTTGLEEELTNNFDPNPDLGYFVFSGSGHVLWFSPQLAVNGVSLQTWVSQMVTGSTAWADQQ